jgi:hypothetical protein
MLVKSTFLIANCGNIVDVNRVIPVSHNSARMLDTALDNAMYATCATFHSGLTTTPGALRVLVVIWS